MTLGRGELGIDGGGVLEDWRTVNVVKGGNIFGRVFRFDCDVENDTGSNWSGRTGESPFRDGGVTVSFFGSKLGLGEK